LLFQFVTANRHQKRQLFHEYGNDSQKCRAGRKTACPKQDELHPGQAVHAEKDRLHPNLRSLPCAGNHTMRLKPKDLSHHLVGAVRRRKVAAVCVVILFEIEAASVRSHGDGPSQIQKKAWWKFRRQPHLHALPQWIFRRQAVEEQAPQMVKAQGASILGAHKRVEMGGFGKPRLPQ
jgi:hypothetical protein